MITEGFDALTSVLAVSRGPHWNVPRAKLERVGSAYGAVIDHYFPDDRIGEISLLGGAAIATAAAFGPPLVVDAMQVAAKRPTPPQAYGQATNTAPSWKQATPPPPAAAPQVSEEDWAQMAQMAQAMMQGLFSQPTQEPPNVHDVSE